jgi:hypothetical protein
MDIVWPWFLVLLLWLFSYCARNEIGTPKDSNIIKMNELRGFMSLLCARHLLPAMPHGKTWVTTGFETFGASLRLRMGRRKLI